MARRRAGRRAAPVRVERPTVVPARSELTRARAARLAAIARMQATSPAPGFLRQAHTLLTRSWPRSPWRARGDILRAVDWLLKAEQEARLSPGERAERAAAVVK